MLCVKASSSIPSLLMCLKNHLKPSLVVAKEKSEVKKKSELSLLLEFLTIFYFRFCDQTFDRAFKLYCKRFWKSKWCSWRKFIFIFLGDDSLIIRTSKREDEKESRQRIPSHPTSTLAEEAVEQLHASEKLIAGKTKKFLSCGSESWKAEFLLTVYDFFQSWMKRGKKNWNEPKRFVFREKPFSQRWALQLKKMEWQLEYSLLSEHHIWWTSMKTHWCPSVWFTTLRTASRGSAVPKPTYRRTYNYAARTFSVNTACLRITRE